MTTKETEAKITKALYQILDYLNAWDEWKNLPQENKHICLSASETILTAFVFGNAHKKLDIVELVKQ